jgi:pectate lyase
MSRCARGWWNWRGKSRASGIDGCMCCGAVILVTNLNDSGTGSFRACAEGSGARTCVFRVAGTIATTSPISISSPYITIAGQSAPGGGITINGKNSSYGIRIGTHDVIMRYIRSRMGWTSSVGTREGSPVWIGNGSCYNIIMDHIDVSWTRDENLTIWTFPGQPSVHNLTFSWSINSEPLAGHPTHYGIGGTNNAGVSGMTDLDCHHNLNINGSHRIPLLGIPNLRWVNNIGYDWAFYAVQMLGGVRADFIGNIWKSGPVNSSSTHEIQWGPPTPGVEMPGSPSIYLVDNRGYHVTNPTSDNWPLTEQVTGENGAEVGSLTAAYQRNVPQPALPLPIVADDVTNLENVLLATVGSSQRLDCSGNWVSNRDAVDIRLISQYQNGLGGIPNTENDVGGYPSIDPGTPCAESLNDGIPDQWKSSYGLSTTDTGLFSTTAANGYTYLENYINGTKPN